jgi:hypothetical protein
MKPLYLLGKEIVCGIEDFFEKHDLVPFYFIILALSYITALILISIGWYIYELVILGHLNQNKEDTITALKWSFLLMLPIGYFYLKKLSKQLNE